MWSFEDWLFRWLCRDVPWWRFWDPRSGGRGGIMMGVIVGLVALICLLCSGCASMSRETVVEEATYQVAAAADAGDTLRIAHSEGHWSEANRLLGPCPKGDTVVAYFALTGAAHWVVTDYLSRWGAQQWVIRLWEAVTITAEGRALAVNASVGIKP
jgi:hypothetical protein